MLNWLRKRAIHLSIATVIAVALYLLAGCTQQEINDFLGAKPADTPTVDTPAAPGEELGGAIENASAEDWIAVAEATAIGLSPWGAAGVLLWRLIRKHRAGTSIAESVQDIVDALPEEEREALGEGQTPAAKRLIRQSRGKSPNIPL